MNGSIPRGCTLYEGFNVKGTYIKVGDIVVLCNGRYARISKQQLHFFSSSRYVRILLAYQSNQSGDHPSFIGIFFFNYACTMT